MSFSDVALPGANPGESPVSDLPDWEHLNPCPDCGARPHDAPEGTDMSGDPMWVYRHCWHCGFRPGVNSASDKARMEQLFRAFIAQNNEAIQPMLYKEPNGQTWQEVQTPAAAISAPSEPPATPVYTGQGGASAPAPNPGS